MSIQTDTFDVIIVGGGPAGLSAALVLGRSRRRLLVCDEGKTRNAASEEVHGFFTRDGVKPGELLRIGREQLRPYDSVEFCTGKVIDAQKQDSRFMVRLGNGTYFQSRKLLLATGVIDELPDIEGLRPLSGRGVFHCPYCHGWEVRDQPLAIYGEGESGLQLALVLTGWSRDLVLCSDGPSKLSNEDLQLLSAHGIQLREEKIARLEGKDGLLESIIFTNGETLARRGLFLRSKRRQHTDLPEKMGCELTSYGTVQVDESKQTSIPGLYVAGDASQLVQQSIVVAADGAIAAMAINYELLDEDLS